MDYSILFSQTLQALGFDLTAVYNCFDPVYDPEHGWPLKLPDVDFKPGSLLLLHFQDFFTNRNGRVLELDRVASHYGDRANQVLVTYWNHGLNYHGPVNVIEFSNHNLATVQGLQARWSEWQHILTQPRQGWQCLNGRLCLHRRRVVDILQHWPNGTMSYGNEMPLPQWQYSTYRGTENDENFVRLLSVYGSRAVNIVTETEYDTTPGIVTEKTLLAIAAQQVPVVIGHQGIVQHCRELGFDMFDDLVDTSYDWLPNDQRAEQALLRNQDLILGKKDLAPYQQRLQRNREVLLLEFSAGMQLRFKQDCQQLRAIQIAKKLF
jgi:hypothetical protein